MPPRPVAHYLDSEVYGGSEEAALHLMGSLDRTRWEPVLVHHPSAGLAQLLDGAEALGIRIVTVPRVRRDQLVRGVLELRRALASLQPEIFHAHLSWPLACKYGVLAARLAGVRCVIGTAQLYLPPRGRLAAPLWLSLFSRIIAVSNEVKTRYQRDLLVADERLSVVWNGIRVPACVRPPDSALRADLLRGRPGYLVLTPARLHPQKGHEFLLRAAVEVPDATFVFAGDGPLREALERRARELGVAERCVFLGHRPDVPALLGAADLFVLPSLYEGLPLSVLEAMAASRPVVATDIGGTDEAVAHGQTGWLVPPGDPAALAVAIRRLQHDPVLARGLAAAGRERVEQEFSSAATARRVMRIYDEVAGAPVPDPRHVASNAETLRNATLRRADWRFLLPTPRPRRVLCLADGPLAQAVAAITGEVITDGAGPCDLAVASDPPPDTLALLYAALEPGGTCYTEWRAGRGRSARALAVLRTAGFTDLECYRRVPEHAPLFWVPLGDPGPSAYVRARLRLPGGRSRRLVASVRDWARDLALGRPAGTLCVLGRRPTEPARLAPGLPAWLREQWHDWDVGPQPERVSALLATGGPRSVSKVVVLAFNASSPHPQVAVKGARVAEASAGLRREALVLERLGARRNAGIPRLVFRREVDGVPLVGETALTGHPLDSRLRRRTLRSLSLKVTDWLAALASGSSVRPAEHWLSRIVEPALGLFAERFKGALDPGLVREGEAIVRGLGALPGVPEQRDLGPWNLLLAPDGGIGVLDWESAELEGLPVLDLLYYLAYASFGVDRARDRETRLPSYRRSLDPSTFTGAVRRECLERYLDALRLDAGCLGSLGVLVWLIHAQSEFRHAVADTGGSPSPAVLERTLFVGLWEIEVRRCTAK